MCKPWELKVVFLFEIMLNVLVRSYRFICIPIVGQRPLKIGYSSSAEIDFRRQIVTSKVGPGAVEVKGSYLPLIKVADTAF